MKLRAKIFLLIGGLFFLAFIAAQILEEVLTSKNLEFESVSIRDQILLSEEARREDVEKFAKNLIDLRYDQINVIFQKIDQFPWFKDRFSPSKSNYQRQTWLAAASLLYENKWIDYVLNTNDGEITSQVILDERTPSIAVLIPKQPYFSLVVVKKSVDADWEGPFIAIPHDEKDFHYLFDPDALMEIKTGPLKQKVASLSLQDYGGEFQIDEVLRFQHLMMSLADQIRQTQFYLSTDEDFFREITSINKGEWIKTSLMGVNDQSPLLTTQDPSNFSWLGLRYDKISMIWKISTLLSMDLLGKNPFAPHVPLGMCFISGETMCGEAMLSSKTFAQKMKTAFEKQVQIRHLETDHEKYFNTILSDDEGRLFFGNRAEIEGDDGRLSTLTIAVDVEQVIQDIALATSTDTFFVVRGIVREGVTGDGEKISGERLALPIEELEGQLSGFFKHNGIDYFYIKLSPYPEYDFNFYLVVPKSEQFALSSSVNTNAQGLIRKISLQTQLIALAVLVIVIGALSRIIRHITEPILHLARACRDLVKGKLHELKLPKLEGSQKDEIALLYRAFEEMIQGLIEKEKVQGVLNKVVSPKIAEEILRGNIHLGGEEKVVTVLFADIRHFTKISESMPPQDLITMLNTCMTKISDVIDAYGGVIDKYVGDEVMALFGAPLKDEESALHAVYAGFDILKVLDDWNAERTKQRLPIIEMGIGIHTGPVIAGNMGAENRLNYTVLGRNVNLASRLCSSAQASEILISSSTLNSPGIKEHFEWKSLDKVSLKGFSEPIEIFQVVRPISSEGGFLNI